MSGIQTLSKKQSKMSLNCLTKILPIHVSNCSLVLLKSISKFTFTILCRTILLKWSAAQSHANALAREATEDLLVLQEQRSSI